MKTARQWAATIARTSWLRKRIALVIRDAVNAALEEAARAGSPAAIKALKEPEEAT